MVDADVAAEEPSRRTHVPELVLFGIFAIVVLVVTGLVTTRIVETSGGRPIPRAFGLPGSAPITRQDSAPAECPSPLTPDEPLRLWIGGDSLAGSLGPALGKLAGATGIVETVYDARSGSGLTTPGFVDWPEHGAAEMDRVDPQIVVFIMGTNDWSTAGASTIATTTTTSPTSTSPTRELPPVPAWQTDYEQRVRDMLAVLHGDSERPVYWVGAPPLRDPRADAGVRAVNAVIRDVVGNDERAEYFDEYRLFASASGGYTATISPPGKREVRVRADDGVHFTPAGGEILGDAVYVPLDERCRLDAQAVAGEAKPVQRAPGSNLGTSPSPTSTSPAPSTSSSTSPATSTTSTPTSTTLLPATTPDLVVP